MTVTARKFRAEFPDFQNTDETVIDRALRDAYLLYDATVWGNKYDLIVSWEAADQLSYSGMGEKARLKKDPSETVYRKRIDSLTNQVTIGRGRNT